MHGVPVGAALYDELSNYIHGVPVGAAPYEDLNVADCGDVRLNMYNIPKAMDAIKSHFTQLMASGCKTLAIGGDHTITYPILQAVKVRFRTHYSKHSYEI